MWRIQCGVSVLVGLLLLPATVAAEETAQESKTNDTAKDSGFTHDEVVYVEERLPTKPTSDSLETKLPLAVEDTPLRLEVVEGERLEEQQAFILGDALKNVSGVNVQTFNGIFDFFVIRGLDSVSSGLVLTDGAPEPEATFYRLYNVERVEVLKGPAGFLFGGSPLAGAVNLVRKQPLADAFVRFDATAGSFANYEGTLDANVASRGGRLGFRFNSLWQQSDNYRDDKDSRNFAVNPALTWRVSPELSLNVNLEAVDTEYKSDAGLPILFSNELADVPRTRSYQSPFDVSDQEILRFQADLESRLGSRLVLRNKTYYRELDWLSRGTIFNGVFPSATGSLQLARSLLILDDLQEFAGNQTEVLLNLGSGSVSHHLVLGLELARLADEFTFDVALLPDIDLFDPVETADEPLFIVPGQSFATDARSIVLAPYVVDQIRVSEKVQVLLGLRYDDIDFEDRLNGTERQESEVSPMAGVVLSPSQQVSFYVNAGQAFAPPSTFVVGEERVPEESTQYELGARSTFLGGRVVTDLSLYQVERQNIAVPDDTGVTRQSGDQRSRGIEVELSAEAARGLQTFLVYAFNDAELTEFSERILVSFEPPAFLTVDRSGNTPAFAPAHVLSFWVSKELPWGLGVAGGGRYVSEQFIAEGNVFEIDDYLTVDAAVSYRFGPWRLSLNLKNLTDEEYLTRGVGSSSVIPAPGFTAYTGLSYRPGRP